MESIDIQTIRHYAEIVGQAQEKILHLQTLCDEMDWLLEGNDIKHTSAPDAYDIVPLASELLHLRDYLLTDVTSAFRKIEAAK